MTELSDSTVMEATLFRLQKVKGTLS